MQIKYSPDADTLIIKLRNGMPVDFVDLSKGMIAQKVPAPVLALY